MWPSFSRSFRAAGRRRYNSAFTRPEPRDAVLPCRDTLRPHLLPADPGRAAAAGQGRATSPTRSAAAPARRPSARAAAPPCCRARPPCSRRSSWSARSCSGIMGQRGPGSVLGGRSQSGAPGAVGRRRRRLRRPGPRRLRRRQRPPHRRPRLRRRRLRRSSDARRQHTPSSRKWRNWQTHQLEGLAVAIPWGFESPLPHQTNFVGLGASGRPQSVHSSLRLE